MNSYNYENGCWLTILKWSIYSSSYIPIGARRAGSDGSMSASGSVGLGFDPWQGCKSLTSGLGGVEMYTF